MLGAVVRRAVPITGGVLAVWLLGTSGAALAGQGASGGALQGAAAGAGAGRQGGGRQGGGGGFGNLPTIPFEDRTGFVSIFDGQTLKGWDGDPTFWRAEAGSIVGESTPEKTVVQNTFLIWRGGEPADFELKLEFRMNSTNSGVQYRSQQIPEGSQWGNEKIGKWVLKGYQADIDFANQYTGMLYEERGRTFLARRGMLGYVGPNQPAVPPPGQPAATPAAGARPAGPRGRLAQLEDGDALKNHIRQNDWNQFQVIARGNVLIHILNDRVTALFIDDDVANRSMKGLLGLQLHVGAPMKIEFRNIYLKTL